MKKPIAVVLPTVAIILVTALGIQAYREYVVQRAVDDLTTSTSAIIERQAQRAEAERAAREQAELAANTMCAMNSDSGKCVCRDKRTGKRIELDSRDCIAAATD